MLSNKQCHEDTDQPLWWVLSAGGIDTVDQDNLAKTFPNARLRQQLASSDAGDLDRKRVVCDVLLLVLYRETLVAVVSQET